MGAANWATPIQRNSGIWWRLGLHSIEWENFPAKYLFIVLGFSVWYVGSSPTARNRKQIRLPSEGAPYKSFHAWFPDELEYPFGSDLLIVWFELSLWDWCREVEGRATANRERTDYFTCLVLGPPSTLVSSRSFLRSPTFYFLFIRHFGLISLF